MKKYTTPTIDITVIKSEDIITTSSLAKKNSTRTSLSSSDFTALNLNS